jgi:putative transcriptional regulator
MVQLSSTNDFDGPDAVVLASIGARLAAVRLRRNITQQELAVEAGISRSTLRRLEGGESTQMTAFLRVLRALDLLESLGLLLPAATASPMQVLENLGKPRQRASAPRPAPDAESNAEPDSWTWGDEA